MFALICQGNVCLFFRSFTIYILTNIRLELLCSALAGFHQLNADCLAWSLSGPIIYESFDYSDNIQNKVSEENEMQMGSQS